MEPLGFTDLYHDDALELLTERVLECALQGELERGLLDAACAIGAGAAAVWRPLATGPRGLVSADGQALRAVDWRPVRSRGDEQALPPHSLAQAFFGGTLGFDVPNDSLLVGGLEFGIGIVLSDWEVAGSASATARPDFDDPTKQVEWREDCRALFEALLFLAVDIAEDGPPLGSGIDDLGGLLPDQDRPWPSQEEDSPPAA